MKIDTPFIEYLIIGMHTSIWLILISMWILDFPLSAIISAKPALLVLFLPFVYLVGMLFDSTVYPILNPFRKKIKASLISNEEYKDELLAHFSPDLYAAYETRVRRVRIIGAGIFNWPLSGIALLLHIGFINPTHYWYIITMSCILSFSCAFVWKSLSRRAYKFRQNAVDIISASDLKQTQEYTST